MKCNHNFNAVLTQFTPTARVDHTRTVFNQNIVHDTEEFLLEHVATNHIGQTANQQMLARHQLLAASRARGPHPADPNYSGRPKARVFEE